MDNHKKRKEKDHPQAAEEVHEGQEDRADISSKESNEIQGLKARIEQKDKEARENYERLLRAAADLENYKKRAIKEKEDYIKYAHEDLLKAILPFIDNLERAVDHSEKANDIQSLVEGVKLTIQQLLQSLGKFGVTTFDSIGKPFDPTVHEAMFVVQTDKEKPDHVVQEFRRGYLLNDRLLRPATVSVSKPVEQNN